MFRLVNPIPLPLEEMLPPRDLFTHQSRIHGQKHVARVMIHAFLLLERIGRPEEKPALWAAAYLHDLARTHDGRCHEHGANALGKLAAYPELQALFARGGLDPAWMPAIETAVTRHSRPAELAESHPHRRLTALLKDADGLDRVRINDLNPAYLRFPESRELADFAQRLHDETEYALEADGDVLARMWPIAEKLLEP
jgi:hypothetical protein